MTNDEARLWEIAENLHRAELSKLERDDNVAEWIKITDRLASQSATPKEGRGGHQPGKFSFALPGDRLDRADRP